MFPLKTCGLGLLETRAHVAMVGPITLASTVVARSVTHLAERMRVERDELRATWSCGLHLQDSRAVNLQSRSSEAKHL